MQKYKYTAININKKKFNGSFLAENEDHLREELAKQGLFLVGAKPVSDKSPNPFFSVSGKVKLSEITNFCRQFSILTNAGISIVDSIGMLKSQSYSGLFKSVLDMVHEDVKAGLLLSEALEKHDKIFPEFFRSMAYVGEMSGSLDTVLNDLADYYEMDDKMKRKTKSAMSYPIVLLCLTVGILLLMFLFVVPTFKDALGALDVPMPGITMAIFNMSAFVSDSWMILVLIIGGLFAVFKIFAKTKKGAFLMDSLKVNAPLIGKVTVSTVSSRFSHGFGLLVASGMDLVDAMKVMCNVFGNLNVEKRFNQAIDDVEKGSSLTMAIDSYKIFPQILVQMVSVGEKTGSLDDILPRAAKYYDEEIETSLNSLTSIIQPVLLVFMGGVIAVMFIAVYGPMLSIMQNIG